MCVKLLMLVLLICGSSVFCKPTDGDGQDQNIEVNENQVNTDTVAVSENQQADQTANNVQDPTQQNDNTLNTDNQPANEAVSQSVDNGQLVDNSQGTAEETANEQRDDIPREKGNADIDWGHGGVEEDLVIHNIDLQAIEQHNQQQQQHQQQQQEQQQQEQQQQEQRQQQQNQEQQQQQEHKQEQQQLIPEQQQQQQEHQEHQPDTAQTTGEQHLQEGAEHHGEGHHDVGVQEPEQLLHGDDEHGDHHGEVENTTSPEEAQEESDRQAELKFQSEQKELHDLQPQITTNVHDSKSRTAVEFMKGQQFGPVDVEEALHEGHHVHEGSPTEAQAGDAEMIAHGDNVHTDEEKDDTVPLSVDPEQMMHAGQGDDHVHGSHEKPEKHEDPNAETPGGTLPQGHEKAEAAKGPIGTDLEGIVHDGQHVHQKLPADYKPRNKVKYQDIIDLGLSQELMKGIDLSKLLEQEKQEMEAWHKDTNTETEEDYEDKNDTERSALFWKKVTDLRKTYLEKLYAKVRHISNPDPENAEWDDEDDQVRGLRGPHEGESRVEHEMEMWASTIAKGNRKPYKKVLQEKWKTKDESQYQEGQPGLEATGEGAEHNEMHEGTNVEDGQVNEQEMKENEEAKYVLGEPEQNNDEEDVNVEQEHNYDQEQAPGETENTEDQVAQDL